tara:strand:+ start:1490 stop:1774 length:285 start_codon:yes stop_codon:yes gene_type:complete
MLYFYKLTQSGKGIVTSSAPLTGSKTVTKEIGGMSIEVRVQGAQDVKFGFTAVDPSASAKMNLQVGDELPLELTDKRVVNSETGEQISNLYWAE